jgi:hypothetical protein
MKTIKMIRHTDSLMEIVGEDHGYHPMDVKLYVLASEAAERERVLVEALKNICSFFSDDSHDFSYTIARAALAQVKVDTVIEVENLDTPWFGLKMYQAAIDKIQNLESELAECQRQLGRCREMYRKDAE